MSSKQDSTPVQDGPGAVHLDENGVPILEEVLDVPFDELAATIKERLIAELEPQLQSIVSTAFAASVKSVVLQLKRSFDEQFERELETRIRDVVTQAVEKACRDEAENPD